MVRKLIMALLSLSLTISVFGCYRSCEEESFIERTGAIKSDVDTLYGIREDAALTCEVAPISYPLPDYLTLILTNNSSRASFSYENGVMLEKKVCDSWYDLNTGGFGPDIFFHLSPQSSVELYPFSTAQCPELLNPGLFRFVCFVDGRIAIYEFELSEPD